MKEHRMSVGSVWLLLRSVLAGSVLGWGGLAGAAEFAKDGGFESGGWSAWPWTNGVQIVGSPVRSGAYAAQITLFPGPSAYVSQAVGSSLAADTSYTFSAWVYLSDTNLPPMPVYGPRIRLSASADLHDALTNAELAARDLIAPVVGWNLLQFTRALTAAELAAPVYFGGIRVGGPGNYTFDDFSVSGTAAAVEAPRLWVAMTSSNCVLLTWSTNSSGFSLQESPVVSSGTWATNSTIPAVVGVLNQVCVPIASGKRFYRLAKPSP
jgi:hypothetical protein